MGGPGDPEITPAHLAALSSLAIDAVVVEVLAAFEAEGIDGVLLKGRSIKRLLYREDESRGYVDGDLLIEASHRTAAEGVLQSLGFKRDRDTSWIQGWMNPSEPWIRKRDGAMIDLHINIPGAGVDAGTLWSALRPELEPMRMAGAEVQAFSPAALALHLALHAAQHEGKMDQPLRDLELAVTRLDASTWQRAARLAAQLQAVPALALGLASLDSGVSLAERLGLPSGPEAKRAIQRARLTYSVRALREAPTWNMRARMLGSKMLPSADFMRSWSPLASRGRLGLGLAYVWRGLWLVGRSWTALCQRHKPTANGR
jgi:hypothetical protein